MSKLFVQLEAICYVAASSELVCELFAALCAQKSLVDATSMAEALFMSSIDRFTTDGIVPCSTG